jgi:hypothetical protein
MADKSRGKTREDIRLSEAQMRRPQRNEVTTVETAASSGESSELAKEYHYVLADLQRIGIIAVVMLAVLIGLALFVA